MKFLQFAPSTVLRPYVKQYFLFQSNLESAFEDVVFPSGDMEVIFNLGDETWETYGGKTFSKTPLVELWGQVTRPLAIRLVGQQTLLGVKFFTHSAAFFFAEGLNEFNNRVYALQDVLGNSVNILHSQLLEERETNARITLLEQFLLKRLIKSDKKTTTIARVSSLLSSIESTEPQHPASAEHRLGLVASQHGITPRYLHKLVQQHTGLSPREFKKIRRFQSSLRLLAAHKQPLTSIAHECGYFDQSHFIRDFKSFTGLTPSAYLEAELLLNQFFID
ncbi:helix-turn-helix transcriptional regulator [Hymenobacter terrenus]|uniref:helix-turn-helix transcriptional regulator n=1 Tax=Hymenobacter terrenus TaxID=1629124 RepID=UPI0006192979|nr:helix-turn-helix transcriptional regulator [Hymenobacter terrenus]